MRKFRLFVLTFVLVLCGSILFTGCKEEDEPKIIAVDPTVNVYVVNGNMFTTDNFLRSVIVENICEENASYDKKGNKSRPPNDKTREKLLKDNGTVFQTAHKFAQKDPNLLLQYQRIVNEKYQTLRITDDELDERVYKGR